MDDLSYHTCSVLRNTSFCNIQTGDKFDSGGNGSRQICPGIHINNHLAVNSEADTKLVLMGFNMDITGLHQNSLFDHVVDKADNGHRFVIAAVVSFFRLLRMTRTLVKLSGIICPPAFCQAVFSLFSVFRAKGLKN